VWSPPAGSENKSRKIHCCVFWHGLNPKSRHRKVIAAFTWHSRPVLVDWQHIVFTSPHKEKTWEPREPKNSSVKTKSSKNSVKKQVPRAAKHFFHVRLSYYRFFTTTRNFDNSWFCTSRSLFMCHCGQQSMYGLDGPAKQNDCSSISTLWLNHQP